MCRLKLPLIVSLWLGSLISAYYLGQKYAKETLESGVSLNSAIEAKKSSDSEDLTALAESDALPTLKKFGGETLQAFKLSDVDKLSVEQTRRLLEAAFAMPKVALGRSDQIQALLTQLAEEVPAQALELVNHIESLRDAQRARANILEVWAKKNPLAALAWADTALVGVPASSRNSQLRAIFRGYAQNNPQAAFQTASTLDESTPYELRFKSEILEEVIEAQVESGNLLAAKNTVEALEAGSIKDQLMRELVDEWASFDPESAATYVLSLGEDAGTSLKTALLSEWAEDDPVAAAEWLSQLSVDDPAIGQASAEIIREWTRYDLVASAEWLNSLPSSPELDRAVASYTFRAAQEDPAVAMSWAESISSDEMRTRMMRRVAATWKSSDPEALDSYIANSDLSEEEQGTLLEAPGSRSGRRQGGRGPGGGGRPDSR